MPGVQIHKDVHAQGGQKEGYSYEYAEQSWPGNCYLLIVAFLFIWTTINLHSPALYRYSVYVQYTIDAYVYIL